MILKISDNEKYFNNSFLKSLVFLLIVFVLLFIFKLGSIGLIDVDEPRYAEAGREMLESGNFVVPYFNYIVRFDKPILFYWLEAFSMNIFGVNEFAARLPSVLSALLCGGIFCYFLNTFYGIGLATLGTLILFSSFEFIALARFSITDMTLAGFISSSIICFFLGYSEIINSHRFFKLQINESSLWYILGFLFLALAVLTKGPIGVLIVGLVLFPFFWWIKKLDYFFKNKSFWLGFILFFIIVLPWYVLVHLKTNGEFTKVFFGLHNLSRYTSVVSGHKGSIFYYLPVVFLGFLPWTFFLVQAIKSIFKSGLKSLLNSPKEQLPWFFLWWFLIIFLFFSFSRTKLLTYILPLFPALSGIVALWFGKMLVGKINNKGLVIGLGVFFLFSLFMFYICLYKLDVILPREVKSLNVDFQIFLYAFLLLVGISMSWASSHKDVQMTLSILLTTFVLFYFCLVAFLLPKVDSHSQLLLREFSRLVPIYTEVATYKIIKPSIIFYSRRQVQKFDSLEKLQKRIYENKQFAFVTKKKFLEGIKLNNVYLVGEDHRYAIYTNYKL